MCIYNRELIRRDNKEIKWNPPTIASIRGVKSNKGAPNPLLTEKFLKQLDPNGEDQRVVLEEALPLINDVIGAKDREILLKIALQQYSLQKHSLICQIYFTHAFFTAFLHNNFLHCGLQVNRPFHYF